MTFGNYNLLSRLVDGDEYKVPTLIRDLFAERMEKEGLAEITDGQLVVTDAGRKYIATHVRPPFPK